MFGKKKLESLLSHFHVDDEEARKLIAEAIINGEVVAINFEGHLYALVCDARNPNAIDKMYAAKDRDKNKTMSAMANLDIVCDLIDTGEIPEHSPIKHLFTKEGKNKLIDVFSKNGFLNIVLHKDEKKINHYKIPDTLKSKDLEKEFFQLISVEKTTEDEHTGASLLQEEIITNLQKKHGTFGLLAITSMNLSNIEESITSKSRAIEFCIQRGINKIMHGPVIEKPQGSYSITKIRKDKLDIGTRQGKGLDGIVNKINDFIENHGKNERIY